MGQTIKLKLNSNAAGAGSGSGPPSAADGAVNGIDGASQFLNVAGPLGMSMGRGSGTGAKRKDTKALKNQIVASLGTRGPEYWDLLRKFIQGKINRVELDALTSKMLTQSSYSLHNRLISAVHHNVFCRLPPPSDKRNKGNEIMRRRRQQDPLHEKRRKELKMVLMAIRKDDRAEVLGIRKTKKFTKSKQQQQQQQQHQSQQQHFQQVQQHLAMQQQAAYFAPRTTVMSPMVMEYHPGLYTPLSIESGTIPNLTTLKAKMTTFALEEGMAGISDNAVNCILLGLDTHLKNILTGIMEKANRSFCRDSDQRQLPFLSLKDFDYVANVAPAMFINSSSLRERIKGRMCEYLETDSEFESSDDNDEFGNHHDNHNHDDDDDNDDDEREDEEEEGTSDERGSEEDLEQHTSREAQHRKQRGSNTACRDNRRSNSGQGQISVQKNMGKSQSRGGANAGSGGRGRGRGGASTRGRGGSTISSNFHKSSPILATNSNHRRNSQMRRNTRSALPGASGGRIGSTQHVGSSSGTTDDKRMTRSRNPR